MSSAVTIPRFLLPQRGAIWRPLLRNQPVAQLIRNASKVSKPSKKPASSKPVVLEMPAKFVPPSHGSRLRKEPPRYPGPNLSAEEKARQNAKKYPNMMPSKGSFMHWFLHNRSIHAFIALGTLTTCAFTVFATNFKRNSPFADMLPSWTQLFVHPIRFTRSVVEVLRLDQAKSTAETQEKRRQKVEDVAKRSAYRKAHGLEKDEGFGGWTAKTDGEILGPGVPLGEAASEGQEGVALEQPRERRPVKKWLGIW